MNNDVLAPAAQVDLNGVRLAPDVAAAITSVVVTHEPDSLDHFTLSVSNEFPDLRFTHGRLAELFVPGASVTIKLGYADKLEQVFDGEVTRVTADFPENDSPTLTIEGHSRLHWLRGSTRTRTFQDVRDSDLARQIAGEAGLEGKIEATSIKHPYVMQVNETDFDFLLERARRIRYTLYADGRSLVFGKPADGKPKTWTLVWGRPSESFAPDRQRLPLLRFRPTLDATAPAATVTVRGQDPATRDPIVGKGTGGDEVDRNGGRTGVQVAQKAFTHSSETAVVDLPVVSREEADEIAKALFNQRTLQLVTGEGACFGWPAIRAGMVVELDGLGRSFAGAYLVTRSTHRLDDSGYTTTFSVRRGSAG